MVLPYSDQEGNNTNDAGSGTGKMFSYVESELATRFPDQFKVCLHANLLHSIST
jgi:hypothetical protein